MHNEKVYEPNFKAGAIRALVANYTITGESKATIKRHAWGKPRSNYVKLNVGGAFDLDLFKDSYGTVQHFAKLGVCRSRKETMRRNSG